MSYQADLLIVDDEPVVLDAVRKICEPAGLSVDVATSGDAGLARLAQGRYRLVLTDLMLPGIGGMRLVEAIGGDRSATPAVVITGYATRERTIDCIREGAFDVLPKPFDESELLAVVQRALRFGELEESLRHSVSHAEFSPRRGARNLGPTELYSLGRHAWVGVEPNGLARIGIAEGFYPLIGEIRSIELPAADANAVQGNECASITTTDGLVHRVWAPVSGQVLETNSVWTDRVSEADSLSERWIIGALPTDLENELEKLTHR